MVQVQSIEDMGAYVKLVSRWSLDVMFRLKGCEEWSRACRSVALCRTYC